jgi:hypothetical protein
MDTKTCPRCAEDVKAAAKVCRFCGHEFPVSLAKAEDPHAAPGADDSTGEAPSTGRDEANAKRGPLYAAIAAGLLLLVIIAGYLMAPSIPRNDTSARAAETVATDAGPTATPTTTYAALAVGQQIEWTADKAPAETKRQAGPYVVTITRKVEDDLVAPAVTVTDGTSTVTMTGEATSDTYPHQISSYQNQPGEPPAIMLQSFSGGAHCCNHVQVAMMVGGALKVVDLGAWDGDSMDPPVDISGDGVADIVRVDQSFLYTFAAYAMSFSPPTVTNVIGGRVVDASRRPEFIGLFRSEGAKAGKECREAEDGMTRNGACAAYVAAAGVAGGLDRAWGDMLAHYDPSEQWEYPKGCSIDKAVCPEGMEVPTDGYVDALLVFLKSHRYIPRNWVPPQMRAGVAPEEASDLLTGPNPEDGEQP